MTEPARNHYQLGDFSVDADTQTLRKDGQPVHLAHLPFQILVYLLDHRDRLVGRAELLEQFWAGRDVYDDALRKAVGAIRRAFDDAADQPRFIETRRAGGYRYIGPLMEEDAPAVEPVVEIERVRGVRVVVEEEVVEETAGAVPAAPRGKRWAWLAAPALSLALLGGVGWWRARQPALTAPALNSLAILPLKNLTGDATQDTLLSDGLIESLTQKLAQSKNLIIIARSSAFAFKGREVDAREIGRQLGAAAVLEGSLRKQPDGGVRVAVRLINTADGRILWADELTERNVLDTFTVQESIACSVTTYLRLLLCNEQEQAAASRGTRNPAAHLAYLRGRQHWYLRTPDDMRQALAAFEEAVQADPQFALAYSGLAETHGVMQINRQVAPNSVTGKVKEYAQRALALDPTLARPYAIQGLLAAFVEWHWTEADRLLQQARARDPQYAYAYGWHANVLLAQGRFAEAEAALRRALELDPLSLSLHNSLGETYLYWGQLERLREVAQTLLARDAQNQNGAHFLFTYHLLKGNLAEADKWVERSFAPALARIAYLIFADDKAAATRALTTLAQSPEAEQIQVSVAMAYALLGDKDAAFAWLERAYAARNTDLVALKVEPSFANLRDDVRYADLLRRIGLAD